MNESASLPPLADLVFHGHFYQPPRENPWTDEVETEIGAAPFHDWNERITSECYRANAYARVTDAAGSIEAIVSNYELINFNFGPTLLRWMERRHPGLLERIVEADAESVRERGHGNAIAQTYSHMILPLADARDRRTQIRWGLAEFRHRFGREAEALWLSETAANDEVLGDLIDHGLRYVILAPLQAKRVRKGPGHEWRDVSGGKVDASRPYRYLHQDGSGRSLALFFYHGAVASQVSFGDALKASHKFIDLCVRAAGEAKGEARLVHVAVDGETAGHHLAWGDRALAYALVQEAAENGLRVRNYGEVLEACPPSWEAEIELGRLGEGSSWSCAHGVGRWIRDCGCGRHESGWNQAWREPLRRALDLLRDQSRSFFETEAGRLLKDPWAARDDYVHLLLRPKARDSFLAQHARGSLDRVQRERVLTLLEMQHQLMLMYTSCGWFFDDLAGIETVQILRYAARALELWQSLGAEVPRARFLEILAKASSNHKAKGNGVDIFRTQAEKVRVNPERIAAHVAMSAVAELPPATGTIGLHRYEHESMQRESHGRVTLVTGRLRLEHLRLTTASDLAVGAVHSGGTEFAAFVVPFPGSEPFRVWQGDLRDLFASGDVAATLARLRELGVEPHGVGDLLEPQRSALLASILRRTVDEGGVIESSPSSPCPVGAPELSTRLTALLRKLVTLEGSPRNAVAHEIRHLVQLGQDVGLEFDLEGAQNLFHEEVLPAIASTSVATGAASDETARFVLERLADELGFVPSVLERTRE